MSPVTYDMSENEPENLVVIMHGRRRSFGSRVVVV